MAYPVSDTFATAPDSGYTTVLGGMSVRYNNAQQAIDLSASVAQSILRFNEAAHGDFWFEADVEFLSDTSGRKHIGLWMSTGNGSEGYRFSHLDGAWSVSRWDSSFGGGAALTAGLNDGAQPIAAMPDVAPGFNVGERMALRCEVTAGAYDASGLPWARLIHFTAGGVLMFQIADAGCRGKLVPGVFLYGATARVHAIAGGTPSGLPAFAPTVGVNADSGLVRLAGGSTSVLPDPAANIGIHQHSHQHADLMRLNSPSNDLWSQSGGYGARVQAIPSARKDIHFSGHGFIAGTVKERGQPNQALIRRVQLISENTRVLVAETWSDALGDYRFELLDPAQRYTVVSYDHQQMYRAVIADNLKPGVMP